LLCLINLNYLQFLKQYWVLKVWVFAMLNLSRIYIVHNCSSTWKTRVLAMLDWCIYTDRPQTLKYWAFAILHAQFVRMIHSPITSYELEWRMLRMIHTLSNAKLESIYIWSSGLSKNLHIKLHMFLLQFSK